LMSGMMIFSSCCFKPAIKEVSTARWKNNAKAAYTIIHDDLCDTVCRGIYEYADTIAYNRGLKIGAGAIVKMCSDEGDYMWEHLRTLASHGHEIVSHTWDHGASVDLGWQPESWSVDTDVVMSKAVIEQNVPGTEVTYFIFSYDAYNDQRVNELKQNGYLGSRTGRKMYDNDRGVNIRFADFDPFSNCYFDAYMSKAEQDEIDALPEEERYTVSIYNDDNDDVEIQHVDSAVATGGWSIQEMHTVDDTEPWGWGHIGVAKYRALLDYVKEKVDAGQLWMAGPTAVIKYIMTKNQCGNPAVTDNVLRFPSADKVDPKYATEVSVLISTTWDPAEITGQQNGARLQARKTGRNRFILDVDPTKGDVALTMSK
jgi:peptidoglycan/xylan/chitin deacetylase (PgdA/CDA1 family)